MVTGGGVLRSIAIDTNLFLVLLRYYSLRSENLSPPERERRLREIWGRDEPVLLEGFDALWMVFEAAHRRIVTQHVVAEAFGNKMRKKFNWLNAISLLPDYNVEECGCCISDLYMSDHFKRIMLQIGPTDAGLIYTAAAQKATILSGDLRLRLWADERSVETLTLTELGPF